jgi:hypothetical protein
LDIGTKPRDDEAVVRVRNRYQPFEDNVPEAVIQIWPGNIASSQRKLI